MNLPISVPPFRLALLLLPREQSWKGRIVCRTQDSRGGTKIPLLESSAAYISPKFNVSDIKIPSHFILLPRIQRTTTAASSGETTAPAGASSERHVYGLMLVAINWAVVRFVCWTGVVSLGCVAGCDLSITFFLWSVEIFGGQACWSMWSSDWAMVGDVGQRINVWATMGSTHRQGNPVTTPEFPSALHPLQT